MANTRRATAPVRSLLVVGSLVALGALLAGALAVYRWQRNETHRAPIGSSTIVMLGDSITEAGAWDDLLPAHEISNRGYSGYTTAELQPIAAEVAAAQPRAVFILTGTNDIRDDHPPAWTVAELEQILDSFEQVSPDTIVLLQTILPRADAPAEVDAANVALADLAERRGLRLIDLHPDFDDGSGGLRIEETTDGIHLAEPGYRRWASTINQILASGL